MHVYFLNRILKVMKRPYLIQRMVKILMLLILYLKKRWKIKHSFHTYFWKTQSVRSTLVHRWVLRHQTAPCLFLNLDLVLQLLFSMLWGFFSWLYGFPPPVNSTFICGLWSDMGHMAAVRGTLDMPSTQLCWSFILCNSVPGCK